MCILFTIVLLTLGGVFMLILTTQEKLDFERERARLKEEIARDKAERKARGGKLSTKLGIDGYNPSAAQGVYGGPSTGGAPGGGGGGGAGDAPPAAAAAATARAQDEKVTTQAECLSSQDDRFYQYP